MSLWTTDDMANTHIAEK